VDGTALAELVRSLSLTVHVLTAYPVAGTPPDVELLPQIALNEIVCTRFCNAQGAYLPGQKVLLADHLDLIGNVRHRAVLLHELVHEAQERAGAFAELPACQRYHRREAQAYAVEHAYLRRFGLSGATLAGPQRWLGAPCKEDQGVTPARALPIMAPGQHTQQPVD
jgi:hypothetical protein